MMTTPICDFIRKYASRDAARLHMPGHKGCPFIGIEDHDITEIGGADSLFEADGIILESEKNASALFGCPTFYSTEGASLAIRAMLYILQLSNFGRMRIAAGRNAHKVFISAAALIDFDIDWLCPDGSTYLSCDITPKYIDDYLKGTAVPPTAVYLTSPDYLGNTLDIGGISEVCRRYGVMLLVDGAHGAYMRFLDESLHPMDLGADMCATSAHKTLPVVTGGAYLHIAEKHREFLANAKDALMMFATTSPSYLILESLDYGNHYMESHRDRLGKFLPSADAFRHNIAKLGFDLLPGTEPLKVTILPKAYGYGGDELSSIFEKHGIFCEFADPDLLVMMLTPETSEAWLNRVTEVLEGLPKKSPITAVPPAITIPERRMSVREASMAQRFSANVDNAVGRTLAAVSVGCPPAVPILVSGEVIDERTVQVFRYYGIDRCVVVK